MTVADGRRSYVTDQRRRDDSRRAPEGSGPRSTEVDDGYALR